MIVTIILNAVMYSAGITLLSSCYQVTLLKPPPRLCSCDKINDRIQLALCLEWKFCCFIQFDTILITCLCLVPKLSRHIVTWFDAILARFELMCEYRL